MEYDLKKMKKKKNGRRPQKNKKWKTASKINKMEDEPINQNQPNWL
jgi:hypothetical protein